MKLFSKISFSRHLILFGLVLIREFFLFPGLYIWEYSKRFKRKKSLQRKRLSVVDTKVLVCIHEWGGYKARRIKTLKNGLQFECGLEYQLQRYRDYFNEGKIELTITLSDALKKQYDFTDENWFSWVSVSNLGFDFSGYASFYNLIKNRSNSYVILSNSSVNFAQTDFLQGYIDYMTNNEDVGILGISYCTKCYQSFIRNNFRPHLQSFFLFTTIEVLKEIVTYNNGRFPGDGINYKYSLIRYGEIKLSEIAFKLGYSLAVVLEDGKPFKFSLRDFEIWKNLPKGDMRLFIKEPNKINVISE